MNREMKSVNGTPDARASGTSRGATGAWTTLILLVLFVGFMGVESALGADNSLDADGKNWCGCKPIDIIADEGDCGCHADCSNCQPTDVIADDQPSSGCPCSPNDDGTVDSRPVRQLPNAKTPGPVARPPQTTRVPGAPTAPKTSAPSITGPNGQTKRGYVWVDDHWERARAGQ